LLESCGYLLGRFASAGLKLLVWGGADLEQLVREGQGSVGPFSAIHNLKLLVLPALSEADVETHLTGRVGARMGSLLAGPIFSVTNGHPALVRELVEKAAESGLEETDDALLEQLSTGAHYVQVIRTLNQLDAPLKNSARSVLTAVAESPPRFRQAPAEHKLLELGILSERGGKLHWTAPVWKRLAAELQ
jgi:hypothetical protein